MVFDSRHRQPEAADMIFQRLRAEPAPGTETNLYRIDGSSTPVKMSFIVAPSRRAILTRVIFDIFDNSITMAKFGGLPALGAGLKVEALDVDDSVLQDFLDGETIKTNHTFALLVGPDLPAMTSAGNDHLPVRWTITRSGSGLLLEVGQSLTVTVQDDLTRAAAGDSFQIMAQGHYL